MVMGFNWVILFVLGWISTRDALMSLLWGPFSGDNRSRSELEVTIIEKAHVLG